MNKQLKFLMVAMVAAISIASCKKNDTVEPEKESNCKITTIIPKEGTKQGSFEVVYNSNSKIIKLSGKDPDGVPVLYELTYNPTNIYGVETNGSNKNLIVYNQDNQSRVINIVEAGSQIAVLKYNTDGYISEVNYGGTPISDVAKLNYNDGNLVQALIYDYNNILINDIKFEYTSESAITSVNFTDPLFLNSGLSLVDAIVPNGVFGKVSKNQIKKITNTSYQNGNKEFVIDTFTYTKDSSGKIIDILQNNLLQRQTGSNAIVTLDNTSFSLGLKYTCN
ncbi:hypothetical protein [Pedobacter jejuensis]|uniref:DUF4595 domain-containing protein n=1 Tax=Pedobacter jejuensis TaxID=1268550 RepID=A0A3N0BYW7_9SPHI|nr:hypothetical protein [Pedobacter jejuensis]RNL55081.1 hypothetical protein D7004_05185 [Pedobacter jejuensis]